MFDGRFKMRIDGWRAAGGGCGMDDAVAVGAIISWGIGALLFLNGGARESARMKLQN